MSKYLLKVEETYRADTENEAVQIIEEAKRDNRFELAKYTTVKRARKEKGEIVDEWMRVSLLKVFTDEKEPVSQVETSYIYNTPITKDIDNDNDNFEVGE